MIANPYYSKYCSGAIAIERALFGRGTGEIVFDEMNCSGNESSLFECDISNDCDHSEDVGVICHSDDGKTNPNVMYLW